MPSLFAALEDRLSAAIDKQYGEWFVFLPMTQPTVNSRLGPDASRSSFRFFAVWDDSVPGSNSFERLGKSSGGTASSGGKPQFATSNPLIFFDGVQFGGVLPKRLDRAMREETGGVYEMTEAPKKDGQGRFRVALVKVAQE